MTTKLFVRVVLWVMDLGILWAFGLERYKIERRISRRAIRG